MPKYRIRWPNDPERRAITVEADKAAFDAGRVVFTQAGDEIAAFVNIEYYLLPEGAAEEESD